MATEIEKATAVIDMDWGQVVLNGGPPCFFIENRKFCGRAERWAGHGTETFHSYVSLRALLESQFPLCPVHRELDSRDALELTIAGNRCVACSLHEREELIDILDKAVPDDGSRADSATELRMYVNSFDSLKAENAELRRLRPLDEWHEDYGSVLWWKLPIEEPPYVGDPLCDTWIDDYYTHWTPLPIPDQATAQLAPSLESE